ncbi:MAG: phosphodiester glycosidase family protein [Clostridia bacterium]
MRKSDFDMDTVTNIILNNEYDLHEKEEKIESPKEENYKKINKYENNKKKSKHAKNIENTKKGKKKKTTKQKIFLVVKIIITLIILGIIGIFLFFKTSLFEKYKELWVVTAMSTMNHQYLATWFLSDEEIQEIMKKLEVQNNEDSNSDEIKIAIPSESKKEEVKVEKITGKNYVGYVMTIPDASKVSLVDGRKSNRGSKLSEIVKNNKAIAGINAGGFADDGGVGSGNVLCDATIINKKLLYGNKTSKYSLIGLSSDKKLVLGKYTYQQAMNEGIESAVEFGPYLIVNGKNQITNASSGGIHPRMGIGQKKDGTFIFVVVDGRQPGYSIGTNLLEMQNIFNRYDAYNAANLDGGSSATMYYNGKVVNKTSTPMGERYLPNAFIVKE